jgi:carbonic anhydrase
MEKILMLKDIIGCDRTIMIACPECRVTFSQYEFESTYLCPGGLLRRYDYLQKDSIFYHLNVNHCAQIIVAGHYSCRMVKNIRRHHAQNASSPYMLEWNVDALLQEKSRNFLEEQTYDQMATELNVLEQLQILIDLPFVKSKLEDGSLTISGIIMDDNCTVIKEIYRNGVIYNDLIGSN